MTKLTERRKLLVEAISTFIEENKYPPTIRELCNIVGVTSSSTVYNQLHVLKRLDS